MPAAGIFWLQALSIVMKKILLIFSILIILISCDYSEGLEVPDIEQSEDEVPFVPADGLNEYRRAEALAHTVSGKSVEAIPEMSDLELIENIIYSTPAIFKDGLLNTVMASLGVNLEDFFNKEHIRPSSRSASFDAALHIADEGVNVIDNLNTVYSANIEHIDLVASAECGNLGKFIFRLIDRNEWPYSQKASGRLGLSAYIDLNPAEEGAFDSLTFSSYADLELNNVNFDYVVVNGNRIYIPANGTAKFVGAVSIASSVFTYTDVNDNVEGFPLLDGSDSITYTNYYCPYEISISIRESNEFNCSRAFSILKNLLMNYNSQSRDYYWNQLTRLVWGSSGGEYITLELRIPDDGTGAERIVKFHDFEILNYLLPS